MASFDVRTELGVRVRVYVATSLGYEPWDILLAPMCSPEVHDLVILNLEPNTRFAQASTQLTVGIAHEELPDSFPFRHALGSRLVLLVVI